MTLSARNVCVLGCWLSRRRNFWVRDWAETLRPQISLFWPSIENNIGKEIEQGRRSHLSFKSSLPSSYMKITIRMVGAKNLYETSLRFATPRRPFSSFFFSPDSFLLVFFKKRRDATKLQAASSSYLEIPISFPTTTTAHTSVNNTKSFFFSLLLLLWKKKKLGRRVVA